MKYTLEAQGEAGREAELAADAEKVTREKAAAEAGAGADHRCQRRRRRR